MLYAQVVLGLAVEGPFDYIVPAGLRNKINPGSRVWVYFRTRKIVGYVVKLKRKTVIKKLKNILAVIDELPVLNKDMLSLTKRISEYYCVSWGQAIEAALPGLLRKGKPLTPVKYEKYARIKEPTEAVLLHDIGGQLRWDIYLEKIRIAYKNGKSVILLLPDIASVLKTKELIQEKLGIIPDILYRNEPKELDTWIKIKGLKRRIIIGTRSAIFAPVNDLGLIIIDEEEDSIYKQEQSPYYQARDVAFMRSAIQKSNLVLAGTAPSLESFYLSKKNRIKYLFLKTKDKPAEIKIADTKNLSFKNRKTDIVLSRYLEDAVVSVLAAGGKVLIFLNRKGFATSATCNNCNIILKCPRCSINLVYYFKDNILSCHHCNFKMPPPKICPNCNSSYIKYTGLGTEKMESQLHRLFPQARIKRLAQEEPEITGADIFISTESIISQTKYKFDLVGVLSIDNSLNRPDFRSTEKTFALLCGLLKLTQKLVIIQTRTPKHYCFRALAEKEVNIFYNEELKTRKQLGFPPYQHIGLVKLRGRKEDRVKRIAQDLFGQLNKANQDKRIKILSVNPGEYQKLRDNFYWQILVKSAAALRLSKFLKIHLKDFKHSGIIVTVDIDPV